MACCAALAIVLAVMRTGWAWILGRGAVEETFPPAAAWRSGREVGSPIREVSAPFAGTAIGRPLAATVLAYALLIHLLASAGLAQVDPPDIGGWVVRDAALVALALALLVLGRRRTATALALVGVGALWFGLGVVDMHVLSGFEFHAVPLVLDAAFHLSGWWLAVAAAGVALVQRRQDVVPIGAVA
jgi:hypothetical protein